MPQEDVWFYILCVHSVEKKNRKEKQFKKNSRTNFSLVELPFVNFSNGDIQVIKLAINLPQSHREKRVEGRGGEKLKV